MDFKHGGRIFLAAVLVLVFASSFILVREGRMFLSPDETANAFFSSNYAKTGQLFVFDPLNVTFADALHPRSTLSIAGRIVPSGFIGIPLLYGMVARVLGEWTLTLLTPLLALLAVLAWYGIVRRIFDRDIALWSAVLLAIHPAFWYYSARVFMPNVAFASLLLFAVWFLVARPLKSWDVSISGLLVGFALFIRPSEALWVLISIVMGAIFFRAAWRWKDAVLFVLCATLALSPLPFVNRELYGSPIATGYVVPSTTTLQIEPASTADISLTVIEPSAWGVFQNIISPIFPFGIHPRNVLRHVALYQLSLFWWMTLLLIIGIPLLIPKRGDPRESRAPRAAYVAIAFTVWAWLSVMYGSWSFHDNPDPSAVTIANSYVRYWIPFSIVATPFAAAAILWISRRANTAIAQRLALAALFIVCAGLSVRLAFFSPEDGLVAAAATLRDSLQIQTSVLDLTEEDSVIVVDRADKLFFPLRSVLYPLRSDETYDLMPRLILRVPLYYYGITLPSQDVDYLNTRKLREHGLMIEPLHTYGIETLYKISPSP